MTIDDVKAAAQQMGYAHWTTDEGLHCFEAESDIGRFGMGFTLSVPIDEWIPQLQRQRDAEMKRVAEVTA